jgi:uncharacterized protein YerC
MTHIGKDTLSGKTQREIEHQLLEVFTSSKKEVSRAIIIELLTDTERTMLAKRLAVLIMLADDTSYYAIKTTLGVSTSTSRRLHAQLLLDSFPNLESHLHTKSIKSQNIRKIARILRGGLPPRAYVIKKKGTGTK